MQMYPHWNARDNYRFGVKKKKKRRDKADDPCKSPPDPDFKFPALSCSGTPSRGRSRASTTRWRRARGRGTSTCTPAGRPGTTMPSTRRRSAGRTPCEKEVETAAWSSSVFLSVVVERVVRGKRASATLRRVSRSQVCGALWCLFFSPCFFCGVSFLVHISVWKMELSFFLCKSVKNRWKDFIFSCIPLGVIDFPFHCSRNVWNSLLFFRRGQIVNHRKSILVPLFCAPSFRKLFFRWRMPKMQLENHYFPFLGRMGHFFLSEVPYPQGMNLWGSQRAFEKKERRKKIPETNMETAFLKQHPAVSPESKHHCCSTILLKPKFTANDFRRRHVLSVPISDIKPCVQEQKLVRRIHKKTWFQQPQKRTSSPSLPSLACTVCHFETVLDSVWRTVKGLSNAATNGEREKEKRGRNPFEVLLLVCSSSSCVCASIHQIWGSPHLIPLSHSGRFFPFFSFPFHPKFCRRNVSRFWSRFLLLSL